MWDHMLGQNVFYACCFATTRGAVQQKERRCVAPAVPTRDDDVSCCFALGNDNVCKPSITTCSGRIQNFCVKFNKIHSPCNINMNVAVCACCKKRCLQIRYTTLRSRIDRNSQLRKITSRQRVNNDPSAVGKRTSAENRRK